MLWHSEKSPAPAPPSHMPAFAALRTPHGAHRPPGFAVRVTALRAARRRHHHPATLISHQVADEAIRKVILSLPACHGVNTTAGYRAKR